MSGLIKYETACRALAEAKAVDEVKDIIDVAEAMRVYQRQSKNKTLEIDAAEIRIRAERRLGELIERQKKTVGLNEGRKGRAPIAVDTNDRDTRIKLSDVGISKDLSSRAQKMAAVPESEFEAKVGKWRENVAAEGRRVTTDLLKAGETALKNGVSQQEKDDAETFGDFDPIAELELVQKENAALTEQIKALSADDVTTELTRQIQTRQGIDARLQQEAARASEYFKEVQYLTSLFTKIRAALGVETNAEIIPKIKAILKARID